MSSADVVGRYLERTFDHMVDVLPRGLPAPPPPWRRTTEPTWLHQLPRVERDPVVNWSTTDTAPAESTLDIKVLATLLGFGAGMSSVEFGPQSAWRYHRVVPSARCVFPCTVWVVGGDGSSDVADAGRYFPEHHQLRYHESPRHGLWTRVVVVVTAAIGTTGQHYRDYAYRLICQEAGLTIGNILLAANSLGLTARRDENAADTWEARLGIDGDRELALAAIRLSGARTAVATPAVTATHAVDRPCESLSELGSLAAAAHKAYAATTIGPDQHARRTGRDPRRHPMPRPVTWRTVRAARDSGDSAFLPSPRPITATVVDRLLSAATAPGFADMWNGCPEVTVLTAAVRVDGLPPALYSHDGRTIRPDVVEFLTRCQMVITVNSHLAAATFFFVTSADQWLESRGRRAYVDLHLKAGELAQRLLVAASAERLVARVHNGFLTEPVRALTPDGSMIAPFAVMVGHRRPSARYRLAVDADR